jgi:hypothetical protein
MQFSGSAEKETIFVASKKQKYCRRSRVDAIQEEKKERKVVPSEGLTYYICNAIFRNLIRIDNVSVRVKQM